ncbi:4-coumarate--CoA ligase 1-like [Venturia canescens]|uniref:4-coumarate--CoA ligase 1-like n=1 Tax=Venturia canescens TaxID=32260 RepID=UPI001C9D169E|nr:4-coumarate--CoA ligase 1-like [Venturia canescens]
MSADSTYCCKVSEDVVIENGIMKAVHNAYTNPYNSLGELILESMRSNPKFVGQVDGETGREDTFEEMAEKSVKCALWMREQNIGIGDVVGVCTHNQMDMYVPCFAALYVGAAYNPWCDVGLTEDMAKHFVDLTQPKVIFASPATAEVVDKAIKDLGAEATVVVFGETPNHLSLNSVLESQDSKNLGDFRCTKISSAEESAVIFYTSGSTGLPKGVVHSHKGLYANVRHYINMDNIEEPTVTLSFSRLCWVTANYNMFRGILVPDKRIIVSEYSTEKLAAFIEKYKVNWVLLGPAEMIGLAKCSEISKYDLSSLKFVSIGGAAIKKEIQESFAATFPRASVRQCYGITELGLGIKQDDKTCSEPSCGRVTENRQLKVIDPKTGRILNPHETGEACFKSEYIMKGYYRNPEATKEAIDSEGWFHTGDLVYYDKQGHVFFVDRSKEMVKFGAWHVSPTMIEHKLLTHPAIQEVAVVSKPDEIDNEHPIAFVEKKPGHQVTEEEIQRIVAAEFPDYMKLRGGVKFLDKLPRTAVGKIARPVLRALAKADAP